MNARVANVVRIFMPRNRSGLQILLPWGGGGRVFGACRACEAARGLLGNACLNFSRQRSVEWSGLESDFALDRGRGRRRRRGRRGDMETWRHRDIHLRPLEGALNRKHGHGALAKESDTTQPGRICPHFPVAGVGKPDQER
jgi:hypothetical protein